MTKNYTVMKIILTSILFVLVIHSNIVSQGISYSWYPANTGGGGYITGIVQDPLNPDIIYARCDVGGVFKTENGGKNWQACNSGLTRWYNHSVQSIAINPKNSSIVFRCSGDMRNKTMYGGIHKSVDGGKSWKEVCTSVGYYGNGRTRMYGELIAIDPLDDTNVITAGFSKGIWISNNQGETWNYVCAKEAKFGTVAINPFTLNNYYAGTLDGKLYFSDDKGKTWQIIFKSNEKDFGFTEFAFDSKNPKIIYASCKNAGIYKSNDGGKNFSKIMNGLPENFEYSSIVTDPSESRIIYTAPRAFPNHKLDIVPIYKSTDAGENWQIIGTHDSTNLTGYPSCIDKPALVGWAISKVRIDCKNSNRIIFSNWYGVSFSEDGGKSFTGHNFNGLETNCLENILFSPTESNIAYYTVADHMPMKSIDGGMNYKMTPRLEYYSSTSLAYSNFDSNLILFGAKSNDKSGIILKLDKDTVHSRKILEKCFIQAIKGDPLNENIFYAIVDDSLPKNGGVYKSTDKGITWLKLDLQLPNYIKSFPFNVPFIENELLNIVVGQRKNVCGTNQLLCIDPLQKNNIYLGEWTEGIFRSSDGGKTWNNISAGVPFHKDTASVLIAIKADEKRKGWIYAGFIREGLWRSSDSGLSWIKVYPTDNSLYNVSSIHIGGVTGDEIYIAGENLYWSDCLVSVLYSPDKGQSWQNIYDKNLGALRIKAIDVDRKTGRIILATSGNGAFYAIRK